MGRNPKLETPENNHVVRLNEIVLIDQRKPSACSFFDYDFFVESVIVAFAIAIDDA